jgi:glucose dehydrogenase
MASRDYTNTRLSPLAQVNAGNVGQLKLAFSFDTDTHGGHHFMSVLALMVGSLSALVIVALWIPQWVLSPCFA